MGAPTPCRRSAAGESPLAAPDARTSFFYVGVVEPRQAEVEPKNEVEKLEQLRSQLENKSLELHEEERELQIRKRFIAQKTRELEAREAPIAEQKALELEFRSSSTKGCDLAKGLSPSTSPQIGGFSGCSKFSSPSDPFQPLKQLSRTPPGLQAVAAPPIVPQQLLIGEVCADTSTQTEDQTEVDVSSKKVRKQTSRWSHVLRIIKAFVAIGLLWPWHSELREFSTRLGADFRRDPLQTVQKQFLATLGLEATCDPCSCPSVLAVSAEEPIDETLQVPIDTSDTEATTPDLAPKLSWLSSAAGAVVISVPMAVRRLR